MRMNRKKLLAPLMLVPAAGFLSSQQVAVAGTQRIIARSTDRAVVIDGVLGPAEWSAAIPVHVKANQPGGPPGIVPTSVAQPDDQDDSSDDAVTELRQFFTPPPKMRRGKERHHVEAHCVRRPAN